MKKKEFFLWWQQGTMRKWGFIKMFLITKKRIVYLKKLFSVFPFCAKIFVIIICQQLPTNCLQVIRSTIVFCWHGSWIIFLYHQVMCLNLNRNGGIDIWFEIFRIGPALKNGLKFTGTLNEQRQAWKILPVTDQKHDSNGYLCLVYTNDSGNQYPLASVW